MIDIDRELSAISYKLCSIFYEEYRVSISPKHYLIKYLNKINEQKILLSGFPKSGNTWARFVIFNYVNILINESDKTLTFKELNNIQNHTLRESTGRFHLGFPKFWRTHKKYTNLFDYFDKKIYIYRNPLDTLISYYYWRKNRIIPFKNFPFFIRNKLFDLDFFVLYNINDWLMHYKIGSKNADIILCYEDMKNDCFSSFMNVFNILEYNIDQIALEKSIEISSQKNIQIMAENVGQSKGMGDKSFLGKHIRSGKEGQYIYELNADTINKIKRKLVKNNVNIVFINE